MARTKQSADNLVTLFVRIPDELKSELDELAEKEQVSTSKLCGEVIRKGMSAYVTRQPG
jgi:predicted transcriptional regulator|tara:strand:+ start:966 stop:1142 length:177 start_codon:yes stop_codon:yes gene_type:complete